MKTYILLVSSIRFSQYEGRVFEVIARDEDFYHAKLVEKTCGSVSDTRMIFDTKKDTLRSPTADYLASFGVGFR